VIEITRVLGKNSPGSDWDRFERSNDDEVDERRSRPSISKVLALVGPNEY
jgi:hypothetical protein